MFKIFYFFKILFASWNFSFQYLSEVAEVMSWIDYKINIISSDDYGKDENAADRLLAKNKVLETDRQTYQGVTNGLGKEATRLIKIGYNDPAMIRKTQV